MATSREDIENFAKNNKDFLDEVVSIISRPTLSDEMLQVVEEAPLIFGPITKRNKYKKEKKAIKVLPRLTGKPITQSSENKSSSMCAPSDIKELSDGVSNLQVNMRKPFLALSTFQILRSKRGNTEEEFNLFIKDMTNAVLYFITHGTKFKFHLFEKMSWGSNFSYMEELIVRYSITDKKPSLTDEITLARIAYTFPFLVCLLLKEGFGRTYGERFTLARALAWSGAPCIIPTDYTEAFEKWKKWNSNFTKSIKSKEHDENCVSAARRSNWVSQKQKKEIFERFGISPDGTQLAKTKSKPHDKCLVEEFGFQYFGEVEDEFSNSLIKQFCDKYYKSKS